MYQQIPNQCERMVSREGRDKGENLQPERTDPEGDLRGEICGLSVHMVTGVCRISNRIQPASLFSITISVKKRGAVQSRRTKVKDWPPAS